jgi:hypothetical protein
MIGSQAFTALADLQSPERRKHLGTRLRNLLTVLSCKFHLDSNFSQATLPSNLTITSKQSETPSKQVHLSSGTSFVP